MKNVNIIIDRERIVDYLTTPIKQNIRELFESGYKINFFNKINTKTTSCDILILVSKPVLNILKEKNPIIGENDLTALFLKNVRKNTSKVIWLDNSDSTSVTHFELLPYVDLYLKKHLFKDKSLYSKNYVGGRIFTDYYHHNFNVKDNYPFTQFFPLKQKYYDKVDLAWNIGLGDMYNSFTKMNHLRRFIPSIIPFKYNSNYFSPKSRKQRDFFLKTSTNLSRKLIAFHRLELISSLSKIMKKNNLNGILQGPKLTTKLYRKKLSQSKIIPSPFGWGELGVRDYEAFIFGGLLLKPDISHMETWPSIFIEDETYKPIKWDFSDLEEKVLYLLSNDKERIRIASNGQEAYRESISKKGMSLFVDWFVQQVEK